LPATGRPLVILVVAALATVANSVVVASFVSPPWGTRVRDDEPALTRRRAGCREGRVAAIDHTGIAPGAIGVSDAQTVEASIAACER
jgi:hypothetical protein